MLEIKSFEFGPFGTNCYVVRTENTVLLIDPACSNQYEQQQLYQYISNLQSPISNLKLSIIATHGHLDHLWGAKWATEQWHKPVLMHEADIPLAHAMQQQYDLFGIRATPQPFPIENLQLPITRNEVNRALAAENYQLQILHTPGHTPGSVCLYFPEDNVLFSGDTLFRMGYGRTDLPGGDMSLLITSLQRLFALPPATRVFPGHGDFTTIAAEQR